ncbi:MAG: hypothetical protein WC934_10685 [Acidithiobacillus sp.]
MTRHSSVSVPSLLMLCAARRRGNPKKSPGPLVVETAQGVGDTVIGFLAAGRLEGSGLGAVGEGTLLLQGAELVGM